MQIMRIANCDAWPSLLLTPVVSNRQHLADPSEGPPPAPAADVICGQPLITKIAEAMVAPSSSSCWERPLSGHSATNPFILQCTFCTNVPQNILYTFCTCVLHQNCNFSGSSKPILPLSAHHPIHLHEYFLYQTLLCTLYQTVRCIKFHWHQDFNISASNKPILLPLSPPTHSPSM